MWSFAAGPCTNCANLFHVTLYATHVTLLQYTITHLSYTHLLNIHHTIEGDVEQTVTVSLAAL